MWQLYKRHSNLVLAFHGCDRSVGERVLAGKEPLSESANDYDWLGPGIYFWEGDPERALAFAAEAAEANKKVSKGSIREPFVLGAILDLGLCCNLLSSDAIGELCEAHKALEKLAAKAGTPLPKNSGGMDKGARFLDCAVIKVMHSLRQENGLEPYDTVRGAFWEGEEIYPGAGFSNKGHVQIAVKNPSCVRGYFRPIPSTASIAAAGSGKVKRRKARKVTK